jgi:hypothetical protein
LRSTKAGRLGIAAVLAALIAAPAQAAAGENDPAKAAPCNEAEVLALHGPTAGAADKFLACAQLPGQTPFMIANSRFKRLRMYEAMEKPELAEAELNALTAPPISSFPVFTNSRSGFVIVGGEQSIGYTQVDLLAARANYRMFAKDNAGARAMADRAIAQAGYDPAYAFDTVPAFVVRARLAAADNQADAALRMAIRAYLRGSEDQWTRALIAGQSTETQAQLLQMRKHLQDQVGGYAYAVTAHARVTQKAEEIARVVRDAKATMAALEAFEQAQLGPL